MAIAKRSYLPRSTMDYSALRGVYEFAEDKKVPFGKALEMLLLQSIDFNNSLNKLSDGADWFAKDVEEFKKECEK